MSSASESKHCTGRWEAWVASAADHDQRLFFLFSSNVTAEGEMDPYDVNTYKYLAIVPLCVGFVLRQLGADDHTIRVVEVVVFFVAALANFLTW